VVWNVLGLGCLRDLRDPPWFNVLRDSVQLRDQEEALWRDTQAVYKFNA